MQYIYPLMKDHRDTVCLMQIAEGPLSSQILQSQTIDLHWNGDFVDTAVNMAMEMNLVVIPQ
jgi:hypothetical protein